MFLPNQLGSDLWNTISQAGKSRVHVRTRLWSLSLGGLSLRAIKAHRGHQQSIRTGMQENVTWISHSAFLLTIAYTALHIPNQ